MLLQTLLVAHIAVLGYWLGSELVINSTFRYVSCADGLPFAERDRLLDHVMDVDQHVRYALILQLGLGTALAALYGYVPGGAALAVVAGLFAAGWLVLVELTHRRRRSSAGTMLALADHAVRHAVMLALLVLGALSLTGLVPAPGWLAWKMIMFAGVIVCGVGIRLALVRFFAVWQEIGAHGRDAALESRLRQGYRRATAILVVLWLLIAAITVLSVVKPALA
ncbi:hypothetical protein [Lentisalinibacter orientalis]|uniref:hypothetical protein n=1 Tax=Lentisalinibacter orientalis TaxID=2992241 RepID=UPI003865CF10